MEIKRAELLSALQSCLPGVETGKSALEGADTFIFGEGCIFSYNDNISVSVPFESELEGAIKAKELYNLVSKIKAEEIKIVPVEGAWKIKAGAVNAELTLLETNISQRIQGIKKDIEWKDLPSSFIDGVSMCKFSCNRSLMRGIFVQGKTIIATDELRINKYEMDGEMDTFWIDDPAAGELMNLKGLKKYALNESWAHFQSGTGIMFSCKRLKHESFPFDKIMALVEKHKLSEDEDIAATLPVALVDVLDRAASLSMDIESHSSVRLTLRPENIEVFSQRTTGKYTEKVPWDKPIAKEFEPIELFIDHSMIGYGLKRATYFYIKRMAKSTRIVFQGDGITHIVSTLQVTK